MMAGGLEFGRVLEHTKSVDWLLDCAEMRPSFNIYHLWRKEEGGTSRFFCHGGIFRPAPAASGDRATKRWAALISRCLLSIFERRGWRAASVPSGSRPIVDLRWPKKKEEQIEREIRASEIRAVFGRQWRAWRDSRTFCEIYGARDLLLHWICLRWSIESLQGEDNWLLIAYYGFGPLFGVCELEFIVLY